MNAQLICHLPVNPQAVPLLFGGQLSCGFPSPAADYELPGLSLDELVGLTPTSSLFLFRACGQSMVGAGIFDGDVLIVDKALSAEDQHIVVAVIGAEFLVKRLLRPQAGPASLVAENSDYPPIRLGEFETLEVWGICRWVLHKLTR